MLSRPNALLFATFLASTFLGACASPPSEPPPAPLTLTTDSYAGTVLTGVTAAAPELELDPWSVEFTVSRVPELVDAIGDPLSTHAGHVFAEHSAAPFQTRSTLAQGVRVLTADESLPQATWHGRELGVLWPGTTLRCRGSHTLLAEDLADTRWDLFEVSASRLGEDPDRLQFTLTLEGWLFHDAAEGENTPRAEHHREHITIEMGEGQDGDVLRLALPAPRGGLPLATEIVELRVTRAPAQQRPEFLAAVQRGEDQLAASVKRARADAAALDPASTFAFQRQRAMEALERTSGRRPALLFLAKATDAPMTADLASVADDASLDSLVQSLRAGLDSEDTSANDNVVYGWLLERTAYSWLAEFATDPARDLPLEFRSLLVRHAGELGRYPDLVLETVRASSDQLDLRERLRDENHIFLEDSNPGARVRAYDWLSEVQARPAGFDPLATLAERRAALAALEGDDQ